MAAAKIFVGGISYKADEDSLAKFFSSFGRVLECKIIMDKQTGKSKGYGFVTFEDPAVAEKVKKANNLYYLGKMMNVGDAVRKGGEGQEPGPRGSQQNVSMVPQQYPFAMSTPQPIYANGQVYYPQNLYTLPVVPQNFPQQSSPGWQPIPPPGQQSQSSNGTQSPPQQSSQGSQGQAQQATFSTLQQQLQQLQQLQQFYQMQQQLYGQMYQQMPGQYPVNQQMGQPQSPQSDQTK